MTQRLSILVLVLGVGSAAACGDDDGPGDGGGGDGRDTGACTVGDWRCDGDYAEHCVGGVWTDAVDCAADGHVCVDGLGCADCIPGHSGCDGNDVRECTDDGTYGAVLTTCDPAEGESCDPASGVCISPCREAAADRSNIGCEYWAVDLDNAENNAGDFAASAQFAVVVANLNNTYLAEVFVERDNAAPGQPHDLEQIDYVALDPGDLHIFRLPRWDVDGDNPEGRDNDPQTTLSRRVFRVHSSIPVVAYQFQPIVQAFSNGASLLLPTTALDNDYYVVNWPPANPMRIPGMLEFPNRAYVTLVATADGTEVRVTPTYKIMAGVGDPPVDAIEAGVETTFFLDRFDVLNLENEAMARMTDPLPELTGTTVRTDPAHPVVVFAGNDLAVVGDQTLPDGTTDACCAEHMEAQVPPTSSLGTKFVVPRSPIRSSNPSEWTEYDYYRIFAVRDGTHVETGTAGIGPFDLNEGEFVTFSTPRGLVVTSNIGIHLVQYLTARDQCYYWRTTAGGDPDMMYVPSVEQRRTTYIFATGEGFSENWAVVSMPDGATATLDGEDVAGTCGAARTDGELDGTTYKSYYCPILDGRHQLDAVDERTGVTVYGYYNAGSYAYPAGADVRRIFFE